MTFPSTAPTGTGPIAFFGAPRSQAPALTAAAAPTGRLGTDQFLASTCARTAPSPPATYALAVLPDAPSDPAIDADPVGAARANIEGFAGLADGDAAATREVAAGIHFDLRVALVSVPAGRLRDTLLAQADLLENVMNGRPVDVAPTRMRPLLAQLVQTIASADPAARGEAHDALDSVVRTVATSTRDVARSRQAPQAAPATVDAPADPAPPAAEPSRLAELERKLAWQNLCDFTALGQDTDTPRMIAGPMRAALERAVDAIDPADRELRNQLFRMVIRLEDVERGATAVTADLLGAEFKGMLDQIDGGLAAGAESTRGAMGELLATLSAETEAAAKAPAPVSTFLGPDPVGGAAYAAPAEVQDPEAHGRFWTKFGAFAFSSLSLLIPGSWGVSAPATLSTGVDFLTNWAGWQDHQRAA